MDCKLQKNAFGEYYLIVPYTVTCKKTPKEFKNPAACDPGVKKFLTVYAPNDQEAFMMGNKWATTVTNLAARPSLL